MINRLSLWPFYLVMMCYTTAAIFLCIVAANEGNEDLLAVVEAVGSYVTCEFIGLVLLTVTAHWDLLSALLLFQHSMGPSQALVRRDEHFEHERRILKRYMIFAAITTPVGFVETVAILTNTKSLLIAFDYVALISAIAFFLIITVSFFRFRRRLKLYYADAYQDHKWYLIAEFVFCIFGVILAGFADIAELI